MDAYYGFREHGCRTYTGPIFYVDDDLEFISGHWCENDIETRKLTHNDYEIYRKGCDRYELVYENSICGKGYDCQWIRK